jgi:parallel beta helix pectate lyase-like protein
VLDGRTEAQSRAERTGRIATWQFSSFGSNTVGRARYQDHQDGHEGAGRNREYEEFTALEISESMLKSHELVRHRLVTRELALGQSFVLSSYLVFDGLFGSSVGPNMKFSLGFGLITFLLIVGGVGAGMEDHRDTVAAKTYYISSTSGSDTNDALNPAHPWQHLSKIYLKSDSKNKFQPGDRILLKRGDRWDGQIRLQASGTAQNPVVLGAYGEGPKPTLYGDNPELQWEAVAGRLGIYAADMGRGSVLGAVFLSGKNTRAIYPGGSLDRTDCLEAFLNELQSGAFAGQYEGRLWVRTGDDRPPRETVQVFRYAGVLLADSSYVHIENLDIERFYTGIDATGSHHILIHHIDVQDVLGIGIYLRSGDVNCLVESNTIHRGGNTALYVLKGNSNTFRDNWISQVNIAILGIHMGGDKMGVGLQESQRSIVEYNYFTQSGGIDFYHEHDSNVRYNYLYQVRSAGSPNGTNLNVYGNIYSLSGGAGERGGSGINVGITGPGTIAVFNNTIVNAASYFLMGSTKNAGKIVFSDNLLSSTGSQAPLVTFDATVTSAHNCFFSSGQPLFRYSNEKFSSLKAYQAATILDHDSIFGDPRFLVQAPTVPLDFRTSVTSPCNSPARFVLLPNRSDARTYDHDRKVDGAAVIGAFRVDRKGSENATSEQSCKVHCFGRSFPVASGVYLISLKFAPVVLTKKTEFSFALNGRKVVAEFDSVPGDHADDPLERKFLVRPDGRSIVLRQDPGGDSSVVTDVNIRVFDRPHGRELQVIAW